MLFFWTFYSSKNPEKEILYTINVSWAADQHVRMISEGSCDTEDWSNDAENSALITGINYTLLYIHIENSWFTLE